MTPAVVGADTLVGSLLLRLRPHHYIVHSGQLSRGYRELTDDGRGGHIVGLLLVGTVMDTKTANAPREKMRLGDSLLRAALSCHMSALKPCSCFRSIPNQRHTRRPAPARWQRPSVPPPTTRDRLRCKATDGGNTYKNCIELALCRSDCAVRLKCRHPCDRYLTIHSSN
jgi:hypothetical protein